jgi:hypothetical protein
VGGEETRSVAERHGAQTHKGWEGGHLHELLDRLSVLVELHGSDAAYLAWQS